MISEEIVHINGIPKKVVVFLHGYQDCAEHIDHRTTKLQELKDVVLHIPQAPFLNEVDPTKRQWYSIHQFDPDDKRRITASWDEVVELYNRMTVGLETANHYILEYIDTLLNEYSLAYEDLFLCGFSQGAMCALYSGLMCPHKIGGVISFSGIFAAQGYVKQHYNSTPDFLLIHGDEDTKVRFDAMEFTAQQLKSLGCCVDLFTAKQSGHRIMPESIDAAYSFIDNKIREKAVR